MSRRIGEAARGTAAITSTALRVTGVADATAAGATDSRTAAQSLTRMAADLHALVGRFRYDETATPAGPLRLVTAG